jgi:hypothetical protein
MDDVEIVAVHNVAYSLRAGAFVHVAALRTAVPSAAPVLADAAIKSTDAEMALT